ncbi:phosphonate metabolism transcriptional regulator PhnF [Acinetobacter sp. B51(2017)]|uniref:phosphonate metabolism transcriptional regulator PhnF n=1 Tax=Acinetobacter sp. B51(2017) TaxID=2060938 RepID=UPI000F0770B3|nr:phosphonate metabolism transcriptional regulator PhnF [Acinetobacter sp. B51(2017)]
MTMTLLKRNSTEKIYSQIANVLRQDISQHYQPGDCLASEFELAERFQVNRHTIRHAIEALIQEGVVERRHGKGTFVLTQPIDYTVAAKTRFTQTLKNLGKTTSMQVRRKVVMPAETGVAQHLALKPRDPVICIETLRLADQQPICVSSHYFPQCHFPDFLELYQTGSLHGFIQQHYGWPLKRIESLVSAVLPQGDDAALLSMPKSQPILRVKSINVNERDGTPLEYALTRFCADRIQLRINL